MMLRYLKGDRSAQIRERLAQSLFDDTRDPNISKLQAQIEQLAKEVRLQTGQDWHADRYSHAIFIEVVRLLLADLTAPKADGGAQFSVEPAQAAGMIYTRYVNDVREWEQSRKMGGARTPISLFNPQPVDEDNGK
jgi:hypothetical protein